MVGDYFEKNPKVFYVILGLSILPLITGGYITYLIVEYNNTIKGFGINEWIWAYTALAFIMGLNGVPNNLVAVTGGYYLGIGSLFYLSPAYMIACVIGYVFGVYFVSEDFKNTLLTDDNINKYVKNMNKSEFATVVFTKISPVLPFLLTNALFGMLRYKFKNFLLGCFVGKLPRVLLFTFLGTTLKSIQDIANKNYGKETWVYLVLGGLVLISFLGLYFLVIKPAQKNESL